jgi:DNA-binding response OmpR family regulator
VARVLVCEDDPGVARLLCLTFRLEGHDVETVADGGEATRRLDGPVPDLLLLDIMLPERDGLEVLRDLRRRPEWATCRVIVLTALDRDDEVWRGWASGADYYLTKPFDIAQLRDAATRLLHSEPLDHEPAAS